MPFKDPEARRAYVKAYLLRNKERLNAINRAYYAANAAQRRAYSRAYHAAHRERILLEHKIWYEDHKNDPAFRIKKQKQLAAWQKANSDKVIAAAERRRANKTNASRNDLTIAQWREIKAAYGYRCVYCGRKMEHLTQDHIIPLSQGGEHTASNIVPACPSCNSKKGVKAPLIPVQPLLFLVAPPKKKTG